MNTEKVKENARSSGVYSRRLPAWPREEKPDGDRIKRSKVTHRPSLKKDMKGPSLKKVEWSMPSDVADKLRRIRAENRR